jgi:hypothetical protein
MTPNPAEIRYRTKPYSSWMFDKPRGAEILQEFAVDNR